MEYTRSLLKLAGVVAAFGVVAFWMAFHPATSNDLHTASTSYARERLSSATVGVPLGLAAAAFVAAFVVSQRAARRIVRSRIILPTVETGRSERPELRELRSALVRVAGASATPDMVAFTDTLIQGAVRCRASDVHLHPLDNQTSISFRIQGVLEDIVSMPREHHKQLVSRVKVMAKLNLFRSDRPQDGHISIDGEAGMADVRVSVLPTNHGEKVVLRIGNTGVQIPALDELGMPQKVVENFRQFLSRPQGIVFLTGPTGSGKTTTIYSSLAHIERERGATTQIATIEDPIEFDVPFLTQTQVNPEVGLTFAAGLRSILRQDPNVIMVGEIRDAETAQIAVQAGLTGHQIVTTVHAESAAGAFNRIIEMGIEPFLLASASLASLAQRLVRSLCPHCKVSAEPSADERTRLAAAGLPLTGYPAAKGCKQCEHSGYAGRTALSELLQVTPTVRELMNAKVPTSRIHEAALAQGMQPLLHAGVERALAGATSLGEVFRVCG